jgi:SAM-dependent methyltransferase
MVVNPQSQYETDQNLRARQRLWERQEPAFDLVSWTLELAGVSPGVRVLDVGCGNGRYLAAMRSLGVNAVGCDLSIGMLRTGQGGDVIAADAIALPFPGRQFDVVLAPHMLYHVSDRTTAALEFRRVLAPAGHCVVVANGARHLAPLRALVQEAAATFHPGWSWVDRLGEAFSLENGADQLAAAFDDVRCVRPEEPGRAVVTDPAVIAGYVGSLGDLYWPELSCSWDRLVEAVGARAAEIIDRKGAVVVEGDVGGFICS